jgi:hypothetical protein
METWTAGQLGHSNGAYSGRNVRFMADGMLVEGTLTLSDKIPHSTKTMLVVGSCRCIVLDPTPVTVY